MTATATTTPSTPAAAMARARAARSSCSSAASAASSSWRATIAALRAWRSEAALSGSSTSALTSTCPVARPPRPAPGCRRPPTSGRHRPRRRHTVPPRADSASTASELDPVGRQLGDLVGGGDPGRLSRHADRSRSRPTHAAAAACSSAVQASAAPRRRSGSSRPSIAWPGALDIRMEDAVYPPRSSFHRPPGRRRTQPPAPRRPWPQGPRAWSRYQSQPPEHRPRWTHGRGLLAAIAWSVRRTVSGPGPSLSAHSRPAAPNICRACSTAFDDATAIEHPGRLPAASHGKASTSSVASARSSVPSDGEHGGSGGQGSHPPRLPPQSLTSCFPRRLPAVPGSPTQTRRAPRRTPPPRGAGGGDRVGAGGQHRALDRPERGRGAAAMAVARSRA